MKNKRQFFVGGSSSSRKGIEPQSLVGAIHELPLQNDNHHVVQRTRKRGSKFLLCLTAGALYLLFSSVALANNLNISNVTIASQDTSANTVTLQFDISWDNSWYDSINKDAAWVFIKYTTSNSDTWHHALLKTSGTNPSGFSTGSGTAIEIVVSQDKRGAFIQRSSQGSGTLSTTSVQFVWDYGVDGVADSAANSNGLRIKAIGIEMTYIPEGGYYLGDGSSGTLGEFEWEASRPGAVDSETDLMTFASGETDDDQWYYNTDSSASSDDVASGTLFTVSSSFPKGYAAFYLMKYEITEGEYVNFLNTLSRLQQNKRVESDVSGDSPVGNKTYVLANASSAASANRNTVQCPGSGNGTTNPIFFTTSRSDRACSYLSWQDLAAYLDWAALRPFTEMEFEKACRGPIYPVDGEYAWGTTSITGAAAGGISLNPETGAETISTSGANAVYNNVTFSSGDSGTGPLRVGILATSATTETRLTTGAGYYGNMDLSGSLWERPVTVGNASGRGFSGSHGDGALTTLTSYEGNADNPDWPLIDATDTARGITSSTGSGFRGGSWNNTSAYLVVSDRYYAGDANDTRASTHGGRGARTASA